MEVSSGKLRTTDRDNSMGLVRYYLALAVFVEHFNTVYGTEIWFPTSSYDAVGGFFALSGYLVYKSYLSSRNLKHYFVKRGKRILPPYLFIVLLCAFGLVGVSSLSAESYFTDSGWWKYLAANLTFLNFLHPDLPGVFTDAPVHAVNGSLWTMKIEILLYASVPIAACIIRWLHRRYSVDRPFGLFVAIYVLSVAYRIAFSEIYLITGKEIYNILSRQVFGQLMYFYTGVLIYFYSASFQKYKWRLVAVALTMILLRDRMPYFDIIVEPAIVSVVTLAFSTVRKYFSAFNRNNVSYDIYLYHFPVLLLAYTELYTDGVPASVCFLVSLAATAVLGAVSWFCIGRRFVGSK